MPRMSFAGTIPGRGAGIAGAIKAGAESYFGMKEKRLEREVDLAKISYDKKQKAATLIMNQTKDSTVEIKRKIGETQAGQIIIDAFGQEVFDTWMEVEGKGKKSDENIKTVRKFKDLAAKEGYTLNLSPTLPLKEQAKSARRLYSETSRIALEKKEKRAGEPTTKQRGRMGAIRSGLMRGNVVIGQEWGAPREFPIKSQDDVLAAIEYGGFDPTDPYWKEALDMYETVVMRTPKGELRNMPIAKIQEALANGWTEVE